MRRRVGPLLERLNTLNKRRRILTLGCATATRWPQPPGRPFRRLPFVSKIATTNNTAIQSTGLRIKVSDGNIDIDEIEVDTAAPVAPQAAPVLSIARTGSDLTISWTGTGTLQVADGVLGPWTDLPGGPPQKVSIRVGTNGFYRVGP